MSVDSLVLLDSLSGWGEFKGVEQYKGVKSRGIFQFKDIFRVVFFNICIHSALVIIRSSLIIIKNITNHCVCLERCQRVTMRVTVICVENLFIVEQFF